MAAYYNENDKFAAAWLRELIKAKLIADGEVDERSIEDVRPDDLRGFVQCHFFAGIGGWSYALRLAGWPDERECWTGSCPCQPWSSAGAGLESDDPRDLWPTWFKLLRVRVPRTVFGEQVAGKAGGAWLDRVHSDMEAIGYAIGPVDLPAASIGAPHARQRVWFVADAYGAVSGEEWLQRSGPVVQSDQDSPTRSPWSDVEYIECRDGRRRPIEPGLKPLAHGIPNRLVKLRGYGNAIVPQVAAEVIAAYMEICEMSVPEGRDGQ